MYIATASLKLALSYIGKASMTTNCVENFCARFPKKVSHTGNSDMVINFITIFNILSPNQWAMGATRGPSTNFMWIYCTSLCYLHQLQPFNRRDSKPVTILTHIDLWAISSGCVYLTRNRLMPAGHAGV